MRLNNTQPEALISNSQHFVSEIQVTGNIGLGDIANVDYGNEEVGSFTYNIEQQLEKNYTINLLDSAYINGYGEAVRCIDLEVSIHFQHESKTLKYPNFKPSCVFDNAQSREQAIKNMLPSAYATAASMAHKATLDYYFPDVSMATESNQMPPLETATGITATPPTNKQAPGYTLLIYAFYHALFCAGDLHREFFEVLHPQEVDILTAPEILTALTNRKINLSHLSRNVLRLLKNNIIHMQQFADLPAGIVAHLHNNHTASLLLNKKIFLHQLAYVTPLIGAMIATSIEIQDILQNATDNDQSDCYIPNKVWAANIIFRCLNIYNGTPKSIRTDTTNELGEAITYFQADSVEMVVNYLRNMMVPENIMIPAVMNQVLHALINKIKTHVDSIIATSAFTHTFFTHLATVAALPNNDPQATFLHIMEIARQKLEEINGIGNRYRMLRGGEQLQLCQHLKQFDGLRAFLPNPENRMLYTHR